MASNSHCITISLAIIAYVSGIFGQLVDKSAVGSAPIFGAKTPPFYGYGGIPAADGSGASSAEAKNLEARDGLSQYDNSFGGQAGGGGGSVGDSGGGSYGNGGGGGYGGYGGGGHDGGVKVLKSYFDDQAAASNATPILRPPTPVFVRTPWFMPTAFYGHWGGVVYKSPYFFAGIYDPPKQIPNYDAKVAYGDGYGVDAWYASRGQGNFKPVEYDNTLDLPDGGGLGPAANNGGWDGYGLSTGPHSIQARGNSKIPAEYMNQYAAANGGAGGAGAAGVGGGNGAVGISARIGNDERETGQQIPPEYMQQYAASNNNVAPRAAYPARTLASYGENIGRRR